MILYHSNRDATDLVGKRVVVAGEGCGKKMAGATNNKTAIGRRQLRYRGIALSRHRVIGLWFWEAERKSTTKPNDMSLGFFVIFLLGLD